jgi:site-specific recombinase XerD
VLDHPRRLTADAGLSPIRVHDLRHVAATIMINQRVPLAVVFKTLRHKNVATTVDLYGHLTRDSADDGSRGTAGTHHHPFRRRRSATRRLIRGY